MLLGLRVLQLALEVAPQLILKELNEENTYYDKAGGKRIELHQNDDNKGKRIDLSRHDNKNGKYIGLLYHQDDEERTNKRNQYWHQSPHSQYSQNCIPRQDDEERTNLDLIGSYWKDTPHRKHTGLENMTRKFLKTYEALLSLMLVTGIHERHSGALVNIRHMYTKYSTIYDWIDYTFEDFPNNVFDSHFLTDTDFETYQINDFKVIHNRNKGGKLRNNDEIKTIIETVIPAYVPIDKASVHTIQFPKEIQC